jgi:hypothetical protein
VKNATFDVPPPGAGLTTVTEAVLLWQCSPPEPSPLTVNR